MPETRERKTRRRPRLRIFARDERGAIAVEYALVAAPFFFLVFGIMEAMLTYFATVNLEKGMETMARRIRTGQIQAQNLTAEEFKLQLCDVVEPMIPCDSSLHVDLRTFEDFNSVDQIPPLDENGNLNMAFQFNPGDAGDIVLARAFYVWKLHLPDVGMGMSNMAGTDRLLTAVQVFRNEPWTAGNAVN